MTIPRMGRISRTLHIAVAGYSLLVVGSLGCGKGPRSSRRAARAARDRCRRRRAAKRRDYDEYTGRTEASEIVEVRARVFGYLKSIDFKDGDFVEEGADALHDRAGRIRGHSRAIAVAHRGLTTAKFELAKAKLARNETLRPSRRHLAGRVRGIGRRGAKAEATIAAAKADANRTAVDLKYTEVKAPISGRIDRALVTKGNLLTGGHGLGTLLTKIVNEQPMYVYFDVDERSLLRYMRQRDRRRRETAPGSLRDLGHRRASCNWPTRRTFRTRASSTSPSAK